MSVSPELGASKTEEVCAKVESSSEVSVGRRAICTIVKMDVCSYVPTLDYSFEPCHFCSCELCEKSARRCSVCMVVVKGGIAQFTYVTNV